MKEGDRVNIICKVDGLPIPNVVWFKDNIKIQSQGDHLIFSTTDDKSTSIIYIRSMSISDNGIYTCKASNAAGFVNRTVGLQVMQG